MAMTTQDMRCRSLLRRALPLLQRIEPRNEPVRQLVTDVKTTLGLYARKAPVRREPGELVRVARDYLRLVESTPASVALLQDIARQLPPVQETLPNV